MAVMSYLELKKMVDFLYSMSYDDEIPNQTEEEAGNQCLSLLQLHARIFALGDRYDIPGLRDVAVKKYSSRSLVSWEPLEFLESIYDVYRRTPPSVRQLRDVAGNLMRKNLRNMVEDKVIATSYEMVIDELPEFTKDILRIFVKVPLYGNCNTCNSTQAFEALQIKCKRCGKGISLGMAGPIKSW